MNLLFILFMAVLLAPILATADEDNWQERGDGITLNFEEADIKSVVALVSERTGRNFVVDPRVRGEITVISSQPVDDDQLYQVFLSALQIHGFAAIPVEGAIRIVPKNIAKRDQTPVPEPGAADSGYDFVTQVIPIEHVEASELVPLLRPLISDEAELAAYSETNTLIVSEAAGNIGRLKRLIERVDQDTTGVTEVVPLEHGSASEIVEMVEEIEPEERAGRRLLLAADERSNSVLVGGDPARRPSVMELIQRLDAELEDEEGAAVVYLRYSDAESIVPILEGVAEGMARGVEDESGVSIHDHEATNALIINGPPDLVANLRRVVNQLDVRRAQVLVEAIIAEVSAERSQELGIQWGALGDQGVGVVNFDAAGGGSVTNIGRAAAGNNIGDLDLGSGLTAGAATRGGELGVLLRALSSESDSNILSTPSVMTMDNEEAEIVVGQNVPFVTGREVGDTRDFQSIQREDVGVQLRIRPQINEGDGLKLDIEKEVSDVQERGEAEDIITSMRSITTSAMVDDGEIMVLGGLMDEQAESEINRVPGLGSIPGLGWLFRYESSAAQKQNLMVFLRPRIIENRDDARELTSPKYNLIRNQQLASRARGMRFLDDEDIPVLSQRRAFMELPPEFGDRAGAPRQSSNLDAPPRRPDLF